MNVETTRCPSCSNELILPLGFWLDGAPTGCRFVEAEMRFICEGCGALLVKSGTPQ